MTCWNRLAATSLLWSLFTILRDYWLPIVGVMMRTNLDYSCFVFWNDEAKPTIFLLARLASYLFKLMWRLPFFKSHGPPNKKPMTRHEKPPFQLLVRGAQETPKTTWVFCWCSWLPSRGQRWVPVAKDITQSNSGLRRFELDSTEKPPFWSPAFVVSCVSVSEGAVQVVREGSNP